MRSFISILQGKLYKQRSPTARGSAPEPRKGFHPLPLPAIVLLLLVIAEHAWILWERNHVFPCCARFSSAPLRSPRVAQSRLLYHCSERRPPPTVGYGSYNGYFAASSRFLRFPGRIFITRFRLAISVEAVTFSRPFDRMQHLTDADHAV